MSPIETQCAIILETAKNSAYGIVVGVSHALRAKTTLYRVRKIIGDVELQSLQIRVSPDDSEHEIWIVKKPQGPEIALLGLTSTDEELL